MVDVVATADLLDQEHHLVVEVLEESAHQEETLMVVAVAEEESVQAPLLAVVKVSVLDLDSVISQEEVVMKLKNAGRFTPINDITYKKVAKQQPFFISSQSIYSSSTFHPSNYLVDKINRKTLLRLMLLQGHHLDNELPDAFWNTQPILPINKKVL